MDETTRFEGMVKGEADWFKGQLQDLLRKDFPRPLFSQKVPKDSQDLEWQAMRHDPASIAKFYVDNGASVKSAIAHARKMEGLD